MSASTTVQQISIKSNVNQHELSDLRTLIIKALTIDYDETSAKIANEYINKEIETSDELIDDLEAGHEDSGLVDYIMTNAGIATNNAPKILNLLIAAVNGDWVNEKITTVGKLQWYEEIVSVTTTLNNNNEEIELEKRPSTTIPDNNDIINISELTPELQATKEWLTKQWDDKVFNSYKQNLDLMKLFAIGKKQNMPNLPSVLHEVYSQWRINYLIDRKNKGKKLRQPIVGDFVQKSKAFQNVNEKNKQLLISGVGTYGRRFSPQPIINQTFEIEDNLYIYVLYSYIMSEVINNLIQSSSILLPLQIDFWIIPKKIQSILDDNDSDDSDDELDNDCKTQSSCSDTSVLNIEERLKLDKDVSYEKFSFDLSNAEIGHLTRLLQNKIESTLKSQQQNSKHKRRLSHNRLVCIADRRDKYYNFNVLPNDEMDDEMDEKKDASPPVIEIDESNANVKDKDEIFIFQPPREYGSFGHDYGQEHLQFLSREYMLPKCVIKQPKAGYKTGVYGAYNDFDQQMFTLSFCCHSKSDIRLQWFINGWNMRIPKLKNFIKIWPEFFVKSEENIKSIEKIKQNILKRWKLPITNKEYDMYEKDLLRFQKNKNGNNDKQ